jgi:hypothetical protein
MKLKKKNTKVGQKCIITKKSYIYKDYVEVDSLDKNDNGFKMKDDDIRYFKVDEKSFPHYLQPIFIKEITGKPIDKYHKEIFDSQVTPYLTLEKNTELQIIKMNSDNYGYVQRFCSIYEDTLFEILNGEHKGKQFAAEMIRIQGRLDTGHFKDLSEKINKKPSYKIFFGNKPLKTKIFTDLNKVKLSLMSAYGYNDKLLTLNQNFQDLSPEIGSGLDYWYDGYETINSKNIHKVKVFEWANRKKVKEADFDVKEHFDSLMDFMKVTAQYGSAVRKIYKDWKDKNEYSYIFCFVHEEYPKIIDSYDYQTLKESDIIKEAFKKTKIKGTRKTTMFGKTAIALKNESDVMTLINQLDKNDTFFILDMKGNELIKKEAEFILNAARSAKIKRLMLELDF